MGFEKMYPTPRRPTYILQSAVALKMYEFLSIQKYLFNAWKNNLLDHMFYH